MDLIAKVHALDVQVDAVAKPTIPFVAPSEPPASGFPTLTPTLPPVVNDPVIALETTKTQLLNNEKIKIKVTINTASKTIKSFGFTIKYDPLFFDIVDSDPNLPNVQITFNDTFFISDLNTVDTATGIITLSAASDQGTAQISGRAVAEFELTSIKEGVTAVSLNMQSSSLVDANNTDILKKTSAPLDFVISSIPITIEPTIPGVSPTGKLPKNGIFDEFGAGSAFISGILLVSVGVYLFNLQHNAKKKV